MRLLSLDTLLAGALLALLLLIAAQHLATSAALAEAQCLRAGHSPDTCAALSR